MSTHTKMKTAGVNDGPKINTLAIWLKTSSGKMCYWS